MNLGTLAWTVASLLRRILGTDRTRRHANLPVELPQSWKDLLKSRSDHYRRLPVLYRPEFHQQVHTFLATKRITGVETHVTDEITLLVAASAVTLSVGWPGYTWDRLAEVLVYPSNFDRDYRFGGSDLSGQAHPWGIVILSAPVLLRSFEKAGDGYHLGYHEFAHLLDRSHTGGVPADLSDESIRTWATIMAREEERLRRGDSALQPYGLSGPAELFAVAVEAFFLNPVTLVSSHGELYAFLASYFRQDPAAWSASATT